MFFALSRASSTLNIFWTCVIFWMESCHRINIKTVSPVTVFMCAPEMVLTTCRSSIADSIWPFNMQFRWILLLFRYRKRVNCSKISSPVNAVVMRSLPGGCLSFSVLWSALLYSHVVCCMHSQASSCLCRFVYMLKSLFGHVTLVPCI